MYSRFTNMFSDLQIYWLNCFKFRFCFCEIW